MHPQTNSHVDREQQVQTLCREIEQRVRTGERNVAQQILQHNIDLAGDVESALELIYCEIVATERQGEAVQPQTWCQQFPTYRHRLERLLHVHGAFSEDDDNLQSLTAVGRVGGRTVHPGDVPPSATYGSHPLVVGDYEIQSELGQGGMGIVYKARHRTLDRLVAIKMLRPTIVSTDALRRLRQEAEFAARLSHPNIVSIYEIGELAEFPYLVLEYIQGETLADRLRHGAFAARDAALMADALARAVAYAHRQGVIHRDLKPSNIIIDRDESPKITDFGLAKSHNPELTATSSPPRPTFTKSGELLGTPCYMAPEQAEGRGKSAEAASDIYSLGVILYEMLTQRPPLQGESAVETLQLIRTQEPAPIRKLRPGISRDLETICMKCLRKEPHRRYASADSLADDLKRFLIGEPIAARPVARVERATKWVQRKPAVASLIAAVILVSIVGVAGVVWQWQRAEGGLRTVRTALVESKNARAAEAQLRDQLQRELYIHRIAEINRAYENRRFAEADRLLSMIAVDQRALEWRLLYQLCHRDAKRWNLPTGPAKDFSIGPDGKTIAVAVGRWGTRLPGEVHIYNLQGQLQRTIVHDAGPAMDVALHPDGRTLAVACVSFGGRSEQGVVFYNLQTGERIGRLPAFIGNVFVLQYSADGSMLATGGADGNVRVWDCATKHQIAKLTGHRDNVFSVALSPDGQLVASASRDRTCRLWRVESKEHVKDFHCLADMRDVVFSPDGERLMAVGYQRQEIIAYMWSTVNGGTIRTIQSSARYAGSVTFSPDGSMSAMGDSDGMIHLLAENGRTIVDFGAHESSIAGLEFTPDGRFLISCADESVKIWDMSQPHIPQLFDVHQVHISALAFHPNGTKLAVTSHVNRAFSNRKDYDGKIVDLAAGQVQRKLVGNQGWTTCVAFNGDGSSVAIGGADGSVRVWRCDVPDKVPFVIEGDAESSVVGLAFPDSNRLTMCSADGAISVWQLGTQPHVQQESTLGATALQFAIGGKGRLAAIATDSQSIVLWDIESSNVIDHLPVGDDICAVAVGCNSSRIAAAATHDIYLWNMDERGAPVVGPRRISTGRDEIRAMAFHPSENRLLCRIESGPIRIFDSSSGDELVSLRFGESGSTIAAAPDGSAFAADARTHVAIWRSQPLGNDAKQVSLANWLRSSMNHHRDEFRKRLREFDAESIEFHSTWFKKRFQALQKEELTQIDDFKEYVYWTQRLANAYREQGDLDRALSLSTKSAQLGDQAASLFPGDRVGRMLLLWTHYETSQLLIELHRIDEAGKLLHNVEVLSHDDPTFVDRIAWALVTLPNGNAADLDRAYRLVSDAIASGADHDRLFNTLAVTEFRRGRFSQSLAALEEFRRRTGGSAGDWLYLTIAQRLLGNEEASARAWSQAIDRAIEDISPIEPIAPPSHRSGKPIPLPSRRAVQAMR